MRYCPLCGRKYSGTYDGGSGEEKKWQVCFECKEEHLIDYDEEIYKLLWTLHNLRNRSWTEEEYELFIMFLQEIKNAKDFK